MATTQQIRKSVFETNSSSSHSLTLGKGDLVELPFSAATLRRGSVDVLQGTYGWEYRRYYSVPNKLAYLVTQLTDGRALRGEAADITRELREDDPRVDLLCRVVKDHTGCEVLIHAGSGGIDHQSASEDKGVGLELFNSAEALRDFLFSANSCIQTGNDNSPAPWKIETDRGDELSYLESIREVPADYGWAQLSPPQRFKSDGFLTATGAALTAFINAELYAAVLENGIAEGASWNCSGAYDPLASQDVRGYSASEWRGNGENLKLSPKFQARHTYKRSEVGRGEDLVTFTVRVPDTVARTLAKLLPTPAVLRELSEAQQKYADCLEYGGEGAENAERMAAAGKLVENLTAKAREEGVLC